MTLDSSLASTDARFRQNVVFSSECEQRMDPGETAMNDETNEARFQRLQGAPCPRCGGHVEASTDKQAHYSSAGSGHMDDVEDHIHKSVTVQLKCSACGTVVASKSQTTDVEQSYYSGRQETTESDWSYTFSSKAP